MSEDSKSGSYGNNEANTSRAGFALAFPGHLPTLLVAAPGRVNVIGEHVDYSGYSVFPFALKQSINLCASLVNGSGNIIAYSTLTSSSSSSSESKGNSFVKINVRFPELQETLKATSWTDFLLCGVYSRILLGIAKGENSEFRFPDDKDLLIYVDSLIPPAAGLSSSSALVVAASMAMCKLFPLTDNYDLLEFVAACIEAERLIGTLGGGMDQTASVMARQSALMHIHFRPSMSVDHVAFPSSQLAIVVANSFVSAEKSQGSKFEFNKRFIECKLSAIVIGKALKKQSSSAGTKFDGIDWNKLNSLSDIEDIMPATVLAGEKSGNGNNLAAKIARIEECLVVADLILRKDGYSLINLYEALGLDSSELGHGLGSSGNSPLWGLYFSNRTAAKEVLNKGHIDPTKKIFNLFSRATHVWQETIRVLKFRLVCDSLTPGVSPSASSSSEERHRELGVLMSSSHESLRVQYECSHERLDELVHFCMSLGALGARLTGAGWGGCVVALIRKEHEETFVQRLKDCEFYTGVDKALLDLNVFSTTPSMGANSIYFSSANI